VNCHFIWRVLLFLGVTAVSAQSPGMETKTVRFNGRASGRLRCKSHVVPLHETSKAMSWPTVSDTDIHSALGGLIGHFILYSSPRFALSLLLLLLPCPLVLTIDLGHCRWHLLPFERAVLDEDLCAQWEEVWSFLLLSLKHSNSFSAENG
jgi:hypothetical protein